MIEKSASGRFFICLRKSSNTLDHSDREDNIQKALFLICFPAEEAGYFNRILPNGLMRQ
ncbi:MAG: hypothetical protein GKR96_06890 [Gammaproteobacteria bacterium]|nr:hypothetical protein [Gammaproteobacteria bacterium]